MKTQEHKYLNESLKKCTTAAERISVYYDLASRFYDQDRHKDAIPLYQEALRLDRTPNGKSYFLAQIGICHYFLKNDKEAAAFLNRATRALDSKSEDFNEEMCGLAHFYLGAIYAFKGKPQRALKEQLTALQYIESLHRENRWLLHTAISRSYEELGSAEKAIEHNQKAIEVISDKDPNLTYLYESMANNYFDLTQYDEALKAYQKILDLDARFERREAVYGKIGLCYQKLTNYRSALDAYRTILEVEQLSGTKQQLAWLYGEIATCQFLLGEFADALETARTGLKLRNRVKQEKAQLHSLVAISQYELGSEEQAVREGEKALSLTTQFPGQDQLLYRMAMAYHKLGNSKEFHRFKKWCGKSYPGNAWNKLLEKLA